MSDRNERMDEVRLKNIAADVYDEINVLGTRRALDEIMAEARRARAAEVAERQRADAAEAGCAEMIEAAAKGCEEFARGIEDGRKGSGQPMTEKHRYAVKCLREVAKLFREPDTFTLSTPPPTPKPEDGR